MIKRASALANMELALLSNDLGQRFCQAAQEVLEGKFDDQFVVDIFSNGVGDLDPHERQ